MFHKLHELIQEYNHIVIFRHINPDPDAIGSQFGLAEAISLNYPNKCVEVAGDFPKEVVNLFDYRYKFFNNSQIGFLAIVLDTANRERIDGDYSKCGNLIKVDHHLVVDQFGDFNIVDDTASSTCQLIASFLKEYQYTLNKEIATSLYLGLVTDSNRFLYESTDYRTFEIASYLVDKGINLNQIYNRLYLKPAKNLEINKFILNNYKVKGKVAYFVLKDSDLNSLEITRQEGSNYVNSLAGIEEYKIWFCVTENVVDNSYRVSIRSRDYSVNEVASKYSGGGHRLAAGATLSSLDLLPELINDLNNLIGNTIF